VKRISFLDKNKQFLKDESGAIMTEYVIMLSMLVVATIWMNKTTDTLLFGVSPYSRFGTPQSTENIDPRYLSDAQQAQVVNSSGTQITATYEGSVLQDELENIAGTTVSSVSANPERSYIGQISISLARP
jgi:Flp pilus assembly pilin Flp